jgi:regulatory protein
LSVSTNVDLSTLPEAVVSGINRHPRRSDRCVIRLESPGQIVHKVLISDEAFVQSGLRVGQVIHTEKLAELADLAGATRAFDSATNSLAARGRSRLELERSLARKGIGVIHIEQALDRLERIGLLDDAAFARNYVRAKVTGRGTSVWAIRRELGRKGVGRELAERAISEVMGEHEVDELAIAQVEGARRWRSLQKLEPVVARRRLMAFLLRRGFPGGVVRTVVDALMGR